MSIRINEERLEKRAVSGPLDIAAASELEACTLIAEFHATSIGVLSC